MASFAREDSSAPVKVMIFAPIFLIMGKIVVISGVFPL
jgi:hypothetical protein